MSLTPSTMLPLGTQAPDFSLPDVVSGKTVSLSDFVDSRALLVMFICRHCPYVQHVRAELAKVGNEYVQRGVGVIAVSANDAEDYPVDAPESLREMAEELEFNFPYVYDETQKVAKAYTAACTPDLFLFDSSKKLVYRGQLDESRPGNDKPATGKDLREALNAVLSGNPVNPNQHPSTGCNIKWKKGSEPSYYNHG